MTSISVMMTVFVLNLHYRGPKKNEVPFWLQQLLSLSLANTVRTFNRPKRKLQVSCLQKKPMQRKESSHDRTKSSPQSNRSMPSNGLLSSFTNINETRMKTRVTTDVSLLDVFISLKNLFLLSSLKLILFLLKTFDESK